MTLNCRALFGMLLLVLAMGCGSSQQVSNPAEEPLSLNDWKNMPVAEKYKVTAFERLKTGNPRLQEPEAWDQLLEETVAPAKQSGT